jgi:hypothetical protein
LLRVNRFLRILRLRYLNRLRFLDDDTITG